MLTISEAQQYVEVLNASAHCGYNDWRLPTADELVFTMRGEGAAAAPFDDRVLTIWTSDQTLRGDSIYLLYAQLRSQSGDNVSAYVRAVRSVMPPTDQQPARSRGPQPQLLAPAV
jgi:hypothetical protein